MFTEGAFATLPEILLGSGYQKQDYESGLVGAFSLALLQALNGRNVANPISCMQHEKLFRSGGILVEEGQRRYLRADLFLRLDPLSVGNRRLSQYAWRHENWIEAKFFRKQAGADGTQNSTNKSNHVGNVIADLVRLCALVPEENDLSRAGRYFLHCYDAHPDRYLAFRGRTWLKSVIAPGRQKISMPDLSDEKATIRRIVGDLGNLSIEISATNFVIEPVSVEHRPIYHCILTRIDGFEITLDGQSSALRSSRQVENRQRLSEIATFVAQRLHIQPSEEEAPDVPEEEQNELNVAAGADVAN